MLNKNNKTVVDFIYNEQLPLQDFEYRNLVTQSKELLVTPLKVMALLIAISGLFAIIFHNIRSMYMLPDYLQR